MGGVCARKQVEALVSSPGNHSLEPLVRKLGSIASLSFDERQAILNLPAKVRTLGPHHDIVRDGDRPSQCGLVLEGWVCRYKLLSQGRRQITAFHVSGDLPDMQSVHLSVVDHGIATVGQAVVAFIPHEPLRVVLAKFPGLAATLWRDTLVDAAIFREWVVNVGRRSAYQRLSHLFCEMYVKQAAVGLAQDHCCPLPLTQVDLADATGLTSVHVNRTLKEMRQNGLITLQGGRLTVHDWAELTSVAGFDRTYLHVEPRAAA